MQKHQPNEENNFKDDRLTWASLCHFAALMGIVWWVPVAGMWIPVGQIIGPLGVWLVKRKVDPFVDFAGRESLNFQINVTAVVLAIVLTFDNILSLIAAWTIVFATIFMVAKAGVISSRGEIYRYPVPLLSFLPRRSLIEQLRKNK
ncbi:MAG: DUF4870 domain-containing protein [Thermodesulforhabdaceae bacterium]